MRIGIIGTRGIPNHYGGFEQFAEFLSVFLVKNECEVYVYNSSNHPYQEINFKGVHIIHCYDPEDKIGTIGQFIYDYNCIMDSRKRNLDVILQLGYTSSSIWSFLFPKKTTVVTNMDGLEWKRTKYNYLTKQFLKYAESLAVKKSDALVSDSIGIKNYIYEKYKVNSKFIAYGADIFNNANDKVLLDYKIKKFRYHLLIARIEPENSIREIIEGFLMSNSNSDLPLLIVGNYEGNQFGLSIHEKYKANNRIVFLGAIYNKNIINNLRYYSNIYFHGHTVGGTNPSLLEAMGASCLIVAHNNEFNKSVLGNDGYFFTQPSDIKGFVETLNKSDNEDKILNNVKKIEEFYNIKEINQAYLEYFHKAIK